MAAMGATPATVTGNDVVEVPPLPSPAVIVTVWEASSSEAAADHDHVPVLVPLLAMVPLEAVRATSLLSGSENVPVLAAGGASLTAAGGGAAGATGGWLVGVVEPQVLNARSLAEKELQPQPMQASH